MLICCFSACFSFTSSTALMTSCDTTLVSLLSSINCKIRVKSQNLLLLIVLNEQNNFLFCFWWFRVIQWILYFFVVLFFVWGCGGWAAPLKPTHILHMSKVVLCTTRHVSCHLAYQCVKQHQWGFFLLCFLLSVCICFQEAWWRPCLRSIKADGAWISTLEPFWRWSRQQFI